MPNRIYSNLANATKFYLEAMSLAFEKAWNRVLYYVSIIALIGILIINFFNIDNSYWRDFIQYEIISWLSLLVFGSIFLYYSYVSPFKAYELLRKEYNEYKHMREPKVVASLVNGHGFLSGIRGTTTTSLSGKRQTVSGDFSLYLTLCIENKGLSELKSCRLQVQSAVKLIDGQKKELIEYDPISLACLNDKKEPEFSVNIQPRSRKCFFVASINEHGYAWLYRNPQELIAQYQQVLGGYGDFELRIVLNSENTDPYEVVMKLEVSEPTKRPGVIRAEVIPHIVSQAPITTNCLH